MTPEPPPLVPRSDQKNLQQIMRWNMVLPGLGHLWLGRPFRGVLFSVGFLSCFVGVMVLFLRGYLAYFNLSTSNLMEADLMENLAGIFPMRRILLLLGVALVLYASSFIGLRPTGNR